MAGTASAASYQQFATGVFDVDLGGTGSGESDRLTITGQALLAGTLELSLLAPYAPSLGNIITVLSAAGGLGGTTFANVIQPPTMPANFMFDVVYNPTNVQLVVVSDLPGDYNQNGIVDAADYTVWRDNLGSGTVRSPTTTRWASTRTTTIAGRQTSARLPVQGRAIR